MKTKRRFNIIDVVLIALAMLAAAGVFLLRDRVTGNTARETARMRCVVQAAWAPEDMANQMKEGAQVYRSTDGKYIGTVAGVTCVPHEEVSYSATEGRFIRYECTEGCDIYLTIEGDGYVTERDVVIGEVTPKVCGELAVKGQGFARMAYVVGLDLMGAELPENNSVGTGNLEAVYVVQFTDLREMLLSSVKEGDCFYDKTSKALLGEVIDISFKDHIETMLAPGGEVIQAKKDGRYDMYVTLRGRAVEKADGYYLDGMSELKVGASLIMNSQRFERTGMFYALESIGAAK